MTSNSDCPEPLKGWLNQTVEVGASDLHIVSGYSPTVRIHGELQVLHQESVDDDLVQRTLSAICPDAVWDSFLEERNADFAYELALTDVKWRFRVNYFHARQEIGACFRVIPEQIPSFEWAGFPVELADRIVRFRNGLVLITGITGSGKTTSLAMVIDYLIRSGGYRVVTIEDPVEYLFSSENESVVTQREVGTDVLTFADGMRSTLRQDPDVILIGEIRDYETAQMALTAAETGHLVFSTMHTRDAKGAVSRFADLFPQARQTDVRSQLSGSLRLVISQHLLPSVETTEKRQLAMQVMIANYPIMAAIRNGKLESIDNHIQTGRDDGMLTLDESVKQLFQDDKISLETAEQFASEPGVLYQ